VTAAGILAAFATCGYHAYLARHVQLEDALIYYRYVANALAGDGLVYNPGERFNALTSPLYTALSLAAAYLVGDVHTSQILLGGLSLCLTAATVMLVFHRQGMAGYGVAAGLALVTQGYFYWTFGLDTTLFLFLFSLTVLFWLDGRVFAAGIAAALLTLTRGEGVLVLAILAVLHVRRHRRLPPLALGLAVAGLLSAPALFNLWYYGRLLPHTLAAKVAQGRSGLWGPGLLFLDVGYLVSAFLDVSPLLLVLPGLLVALSIPRWFRDDVTTILLPYVAAYSLVYIGLNVPNYHWYYAVYFYAAALLAAYGLKTLAEGLATRWPGARGDRLSAGAVVALAGSLLVLQAVASQGLRTAGPPAAYRAIGLWLRDTTPATSTIACVEVGTIGWYSRRYIVDILGLVSPHNAQLLARRDFAGWTRLYAPDYVLAHDPLWPHEQSIRALVDTGAYVPVPSFPFKGYVLLSRRPV
jgi:arabinofuranosyltransferase